MTIQKGQRIWELRSSHGRNPIFETPDKLWDAACEYFDWVISTPLEQQELFSYQGVITKDTVQKMRAMTKTALYLYLDICEQTFNNYKSRPEFTATCERIEAVIYSQKFEGAAAGLLNPAIIVRELGLADKKEVTGAGGGPLQQVNTTTVIASPEQIREVVRKLDETY